MDGDSRGTMQATFIQIEVTPEPIKETIENC
jgi:hypothetical protein